MNWVFKDEEKFARTEGTMKGGGEDGTGGWGSLQSLSVCT